jgi:hypothetical protein
MAFLAALVSGTVIFGASCSADIALAIRTDARTATAMGIIIPPEVESWIRRSTSIAAATPLFNADASATALRQRGVNVISSRIPSSTSWLATFDIPDLPAFIAKDARLREAGLLRYETGPDWASLAVHITTDNAMTLLELFPGLDLEILEALQPPALYDNPVTMAEYRTMLQALMGRIAARALDAAVISLELTVPGPILESRNLTAASIAPSNRLVRLEIPTLAALVLEHPIELYVKWRQ